MAQKLSAPQTALLERIAQDKIRRDWSPRKTYLTYDVDRIHRDVRDATVDALWSRDLINIEDVPGSASSYKRYVLTDTGREALRGPCDSRGSGCTGTGDYVVDPYIAEIDGETVYRRLCEPCAQTRADDV